MIAGRYIHLDHILRRYQDRICHFSTVHLQPEEPGLLSYLSIDLSSPSIMSQASKITLGATSLFAVGTIIFVHFQQKAEKSVRLLLQGQKGTPCAFDMLIVPWDPKFHRLIQP